MKRKIITAICLLVTTTFLLTGCSVSNIFELFASSDDEEYKSPGNLAREIQAEIMNCFINKDSETLKGFFSKYATENFPDLDAQIEKAFSFLDGEIISYDEPFSGGGCGSFYRKDYGGSTSNIITDKGTEYTIAFKGWYRKDENPDEVGVYLIVVRNETMRVQLKHEGVKHPERLFRVCIEDFTDDD